MGQPVHSQALFSSAKDVCSNHPQIRGAPVSNYDTHDKQEEPMTPTLPADTVIGKRIRLIEGDKKVTGTLRYVADIEMAGMLHARLVTSPHAHARVVHIDGSAAAALPGVVAVLTAADLPDILPISRQRLLLARERVIFAGQPVALVLAEDPASAEDAIELVQAQYKPLPAAITLEEAMAPDAPLVWPEGMPGESEEAAAHGADVGGEEEGKSQRSNVAKTTNFVRGDLAAGFSKADIILEREFTTPMVHQSPLETHGCAIMIDPVTEEVTVWTPTQGPFNVRQQVAAILDLPETQVRCIGTPVGGGFGGKGVLYELLIALAVRKVGRSIRLLLSRNEEMIATNAAPPGRMRLKLGAKNDGTFTALQAELAFNSGCYPSAPVGISMVVMGSIYAIPHIEMTGLDVVSFRPSSGAYRAPGVPQGQFCLESLVDEMATQLQRDPVELRLQNAAKPGDPMIHGETWPKMGMTEVLEAVQAHPLWQNRDASKAAGRGIGVAIGGWPGGTGPASAACMLERDGTLKLQLGSVDISGTNTGFALMAAEVFGLSPDKIKITSGDTINNVFALNAGGSKITYTVGPALIQAVNEVKEQTLAVVSDLLEVSVEDLEIVDGKVQVKGTPESAISLGEVAGKTMQFGGQYAPITATGRNAVTTRSPGFCAQIAEVEVDHATGEVTVHKVVIVQDVGCAINPAGIEGQMMGGAMQGMGWGLYESMLYDEFGQPISASWMDYNMPHMTQSPGEFETVIVEVASDIGPMGAKGVGEPPIIPTAGAIANAIHDATGARLRDIPMTPPQILGALSNGSA